MFDFSKYNLGELVAISDMLEYIEHGGCVDYQQEKCREAIHENISRQAAQAEPDMFGWVGDAPDMFGWVGDALDDLCAAGEVLGSND